MEMLILFFLPLLSSVFSQSLSSDKGRVVCYYTDWSVYRTDGGKFTPKDINPYLCTHLIYSFARLLIDEATIAPGDPHQDITNNGFRDFVALKSTFNPELTCMLAVGGYREGSTQFTPISASAEKRQAFAQNSLEFLKKHRFDGLNIDWQFPTDIPRNGSAEDFSNFVFLLRDIAQVFEEDAEKSGKPKLLLTISVPGNTFLIDSGYDLPNLAKYVEFMNVLAYDYHFAFDPNVYHHSPLYPLPDEVKDSGHPNEGLNADSTILHIISKGVPPKKLNLGIPLYGRSLTLFDENENGLGSIATGRGEKGKATREDGYKAYYEICKNLRGGDWTVVRHNETAMGPYAHKGKQWIGYDDEKSILRKGMYAKKKGLGGISFWAIDQDDFLATCGDVSFPLIKAGREGFMRTQGPLDPDAEEESRSVKRPATPAGPTRPRMESQKPLVRDEPTREPTVLDEPTREPTVRDEPTREPTVRDFTSRPERQRPRAPPKPDYFDEDNDSVIVDAPPPEPTITRTSTTRTPPGTVQNIYIWITNNIFHHSPPDYIDTSIQSNKNDLPSPSKPPLFTGESTRDKQGESAPLSAANPSRRAATFYQGAPVWS